MDPLGVHSRVAHCVDQRDVVVDQLRHILVGCGDEGGESGTGRLVGQSADHVIRFYSADPYDRDSDGLHGL